MSTKISKLSLSGYRSYGNNLKENTICFKDVNVIIGANGAVRAI